MNNAQIIFCITLAFIVVIGLTILIGSFIVRFTIYDAIVQGRRWHWMGKPFQIKKDV